MQRRLAGPRTIILMLIEYVIMYNQIRLKISVMDKPKIEPTRGLRLNHYPVIH